MWNYYIYSRWFVIQTGITVIQTVSYVALLSALLTTAIVVRCEILTDVDRQRDAFCLTMKASFDLNYLMLPSHYAD